MVKPFQATKRRTFNYVSSIFNLFRLLAPFLLRPKLIIQDICWLRLDWDTPMPGKLENVLWLWKANVRGFSKIEIPNGTGSVMKLQRN